MTRSVRVVIAGDCSFLIHSVLVHTTVIAAKAKHKVKLMLLAACDKFTARPLCLSGKQLTLALLFQSTDVLVLSCFVCVQAAPLPVEEKTSSSPIITSYGRSPLNRMSSLHAEDYTVQVRHTAAVLQGGVGHVISSSCYAAACCRTCNSARSTCKEQAYHSLVISLLFGFSMHLRHWPWLSPRLYSRGTVGTAYSSMHVVLLDIQRHPAVHFLWCVAAAH